MSNYSTSSRINQVLDEKRSRRGALCRDQEGVRRGEDGEGESGEEPLRSCHAGLAEGDKEVRAENHDRGDDDPRNDEPDAVRRVRTDAVGHVVHAVHDLIFQGGSVETGCVIDVMITDLTADEQPNRADKIAEEAQAPDDEKRVHTEIHILVFHRLFDDQRNHKQQQTVDDEVARHAEQQEERVEGHQQVHRQNHVV